MCHPLTPREDNSGKLFTIVSTSPFAQSDQSKRECLFIFSFAWHAPIIRQMATELENQPPAWTTKYKRPI
ncbi:MAG: hypothetical protein DME25_01020 [Verrucomicrobia bacterium]|nr:MAG: hypothetical protein DME25_01020 [Verrucomicrobiota bacterium]